ncbi:MAG TPA: alpha/beta hydrolase [Myxococcales bacterium]|nr:alpha/beta hydrolase [Myxococcales bacterium]
MSDPTRSAAHLRGVACLAFEATVGLTGLVEAMHHNISRKPWILGKAEPGPARGVTGFVYGTVRGVMRLAGSALDLALRQLEPPLGPDAPSPAREAALAALNGVVGDHLLATGNPLATRMHLRCSGVPLDPDRPAALVPRPGRRILVLVHGLCMNDRGWQRQGEDRAVKLARDLGYTPLHLVYNTGLHVSRNGRQLAGALEALVARWPVPVREIAFVAHSMGGLVARSACHYGTAAGHSWRERLRTMVFLGTPHQGAALERAGNWITAAMDLSPYVGPLTALGKIRSEGITDLRHGSLLDEHWEGRDRFGTADPPRIPVPLPSGVDCYAVAGTLAGRRDCGAIVGDGLVAVGSALGRHHDPALDLRFPAARRWVGEGIGHLDLLGRPEVFERLQQWMSRPR